MNAKLKTGALILGMVGVLGATVLMALYSIGEAKREASIKSRELQSIGTTMPDFSLPVLQQPGKAVPTTFGARELRGKPYLLHGWASWCLVCRAEHPLLMAFAKKTKVRLIGYNVDDEPELALRWLARYGDPYEFSLLQASQRSPGVIPLTSTPQLILVDGDGKVLWRRVGNVTPQVLEQRLLPLLQAQERAL
ncbi:MAG: redoxin domain-containing protein [Lysobacter sp.]|nr:MAG: redoxin domain-containing protein [Lysobacter sp.]